MRKIKKVLLFKVVSICVSICFFASTIAYSAPPTLRPNLIFDKAGKEEGKKVIQGALQVVYTKTEIKKYIKPIFEKLRPDFKGKDKLTGLEFEEHIKKIAEELDLDYIRINDNPVTLIPNTYKYQIRPFFLFIPEMPLLRKIIFVILRSSLAVIWYLLSIVGGFTPDAVGPWFTDKENKYIVRMNGPWAFVVPLSIFALVYTAARIVSIKWFIGVATFWGISAVMSIRNSDDKKRDFNLRHELKHIYANFLVEELIAIDALDLSAKQAQELLPFEHGIIPFLSNNEITISELGKLEEMVIEALYGHISIKDASTIPEVPSSPHLEEHVEFKTRVLNKDIGQFKRATPSL